MFGFLTPIAIPIGTAFSAVFGYLFRFAVMRWLTAAAIFALVAAGGYFLAAWLLPEWVSIKTLRDSLSEFSPPVSYALHLLSFYEGAPLVLTSLASAWVLKKVPGWAWMGPLYRVTNPS